MTNYLLERAKKLGPRDRIRLVKDGEWKRVYEGPNAAGWLTLTDMTAHHITTVVETLCNETSTGCITASHCSRCGNCHRRGGPYGCHCECAQDNNCGYCYPVDTDDDDPEEW